MSRSVHHNTDDMVEKWKEKSKRSIKGKMEENICQRAPIFQKSINTGVNHTIEMLQSDDNWHSMSSIKSFTLPQSLIHNARKLLFEKVVTWKGVDIKARNNPPKDWKDYHKTANGWWNSRKCAWIGDYFIYPLLSQLLPQYIICITQQCYETQDEHRMQLIRDILFFNVLSQIMCAEITFKRSKAQPLILDQSYNKSKLLKSYLIDLGKKHGKSWSIETHQKRNYVRNSARAWVKYILQNKISKFNNEDSVSNNYSQINENDIKLHAEGVIFGDDNIMQAPSMDAVIIPQYSQTENTVPYFPYVPYAQNNSCSYPCFPPIKRYSNNSPTVSVQSAAGSMYCSSRSVSPRMTYMNRYHPYPSHVTTSNSVNYTNNYSNDASSLLGAVISINNTQSQSTMVHNNANYDNNFDFLLHPNYPFN